MRAPLWFLFVIACWGVIFAGLAVLTVRCAFADEVSLAWGPLNGGGDRGPALVATWQASDGWWGLHTGGFEHRGAQVAFVGADLQLRLSRGPWYSEHGIGLTQFDRLPDWLGSQTMFRLHARLGRLIGQWSVAMGWEHFSNGWPLNPLVNRNGGGDFGVLALGWRW